MIKQTLECRKIELYCDIHGHSTQKNLFVYGNNGLVRWSKSKDQGVLTKENPFEFDLLKYSINITTDNKNFIIFI